MTWMCGRYTIRRLDILRALFAATPPLPGFEEFTERPHFNLAPSQTLPVVRINSAGDRVMEGMRWGFIPFWTTGKPKLAPINAKAETIATGRMFRQAFERRRCLVPADGFYEWKGTKPPKQPYFIHMRDDSPFAFAGLWDRWKPEPDAEPVDTFTILTTTPNKLMEPIHNRMPVILAAKDYERWLDNETKGADVADLLKPFPEKPMEAYPISTKVNNTKNDGPELIEPA